MTSSRIRPTLGGLLLQHLIVFLICIVFPGLVTALAPASWIVLQRDGQAVQATMRTCVYFVVPFRVQTVDHVTAFHSREKASETRRERRYGRDTGNSVHVDGEGYLQVVGPEDSLAEVSVSPVSLPRVLDICTEFLDAQQPQSKRIFVISNWKFGGIMGGILTSFTALYVVGYSLTLAQYGLRWIQRFTTAGLGTPAK